MKKYVLVFDVDGVITDSASKKYEAFFSVMQKYKIEKHPEISRLLDLRLNRLVLANTVFTLFWIPPDEIYREIWIHLKDYESKGKCYPIVEQVWKFIEAYQQDFVFFTNSSMHKKTIEHILQQLWIASYFTEVFSYDSGTKLENIQYIISQYGYKPEEILFIDDLVQNIDSVKPTGVHTLLFDQDSVNLEESVKNIFWE